MKDTALDFVERLAEGILSTSESIGGNMPISLFGLNHSSKGGFNLGIINNNLVSGSAGLATVYGSLYHVTGKSKWKKIALRTIGSFINESEVIISNQKNNIAKLNIDYFFGLTGMVYALSLTGNLVNDSTLIKTSLQFTLKALNDINSLTSEELDELKFSIIQLYPLLMAFRSRKEVIEHKDTIELIKNYIVEFRKSDNQEQTTSAQLSRLSTSTYLFSQFEKEVPNIRNSQISPVTAKDQDSNQKAQYITSKVLLSKTPSIELIDSFRVSTLDNDNDRSVLLLNEIYRRFNKNQNIFSDINIPFEFYPSAVLGTGSLILSVLKHSMDCSTINNICFSEMEF